MGKVEQMGLGWLDYGARMYDPAIGRWNGGDFLSEMTYNLSTYIYGSNDPIKRIDLFGMKDVNNDAKDDGTSLDEVVVKARRLYSANSYFANIYVAHERNRLAYGEDSPYRKYFQAGGRDAAVVIGIPVAVVGIAEGVLGTAATHIFDADIISFARTLKFTKGLRNSLLAKGATNLLGQFAATIMSNEAKFDLAGLASDLTLDLFSFDFQWVIIIFAFKMLFLINQ